MANRRDFLKAAGTAGALGMTGLSGCIGSFGEQPYGNGTVKFLMSPSEPQNYMMRQYKPIKEYLGEQLGDDVDVELKYAANYSAVLQSLGSGNAEVAETGPFAAALGVKADKVDIALQRHAYGSWTYHSVIVTTEDSDVESLTDLKGKKIAFSDMTSASGSLYPLHMLKEAGLDIGEAPTSDKGADFEATWSSHAQAYEALMSGQVDAAGVGRFITWDYGADDYKEGVREVAITSDIPRAPIVVSPDLSDEEKSNIVDALKDAPEEMYLGADGEEDPDDAPEEEQDDLWFDDVRPASLETYKPVVKVANDLGLSSDLLDQGQ